jgi:type III restriction enzyme
MSDPFFDHPILNSPYEYPKRYWELDDSGQPTQRIIEKRRDAKFITPIPKPKKRKAAAQKAFVFDEGKGLSSEKQQYDTTSAINEVRSYVDTWRALPNPSQWQVTPETARLLQHWRKSEGRSIREGPSNPMRLSLIGRVEADEEILSHRALPSGIPGLLGLQLNETIVVSLGR